MTAAATQAGVVLGTAAYMSPGAGARQAGRQARRHLGLRRGALRDAHGPQGLRGRDGLRHARGDPHEGAGLERAAGRHAGVGPPRAAPLPRPRSEDAHPRHRRRAPRARRALVAAGRPGADPVPELSRSGAGDGSPASLLLAAGIGWWRALQPKAAAPPTEITGFAVARPGERPDPVRRFAGPRSLARRKTARFRRRPRRTRQLYVRSRDRIDREAGRRARRAPTARSSHPTASGWASSPKES